MVSEWLKSNDIMFEILHKLNQLEPIRNPEFSEVMIIWLLTLFSRTRNYYNDNKTMDYTHIKQEKNLLAGLASPL